MLIDYVAEFLKDGKWHYVRTIARKLNQPEARIRDVLEFCVEFNIVTLDQTGDKARIDKAFKKILT